MEGKKSAGKKNNGIFSSRNFDCYMKYKNKFLQNKIIADEVATLAQVIKQKRKTYGLCCSFSGSFRTTLTLLNGQRWN